MHCAFVYPGLGAHRSGMGDVVMEAFPEIAVQVFQQAERATGVDLRAVAGVSSPAFLLEPSGAESAHSPGDLQAAVYTVSLITHLGLLEAGWHPDIVAGQGLGEYSALAAAGVLSFTDGLHLVRRHAQALMRRPSSVGGTSAAGTTLGEFGTGAISAAGASPSEEAVEESRPPALDPGSSEASAFLSVLTGTQFKDPYLPVVGSALAQPIHNGPAARASIQAQLSGAADWRQTMSLLVGRGRDVVVEVGPSRRLTARFAQSHPQVVTRSTADIRRIRRLTRQPADF